MTRRRHDPWSWTVVPLPERDLAESVHDLAKPLLERLGPEPPIETARGAIELAVTFWNATVLASKQWERPRPKGLNELRKRMRGRQSTPEDAEAFNLLSERWNANFVWEPRLVESWTYECDEKGTPRLECGMGLPDGVRAAVPPPVEKRISVGGAFLDEVQIRQSETSYLSFPVGRHRAVVREDGGITVHAMMPTVVQLFAEGRLSRVRGEPVEVVAGGRDLGLMVLREVRCEGERHDVAVLVFEPLIS